MARVSEADPTYFSAYMYAPPSPTMMNFVQQMVMAPTNHLLDAGRSFMTQAVDLYEKLGSSEAMSRVKRAMAGEDGRWTDSYMKHLCSVEELQTAPIIMQRYLMAQPDIRSLYHKGHCDGYSDTYVDMEPGLVGEQHYDYRRVMDGVVEETETGWGWTEYFEDLIPGDAELDDFDRGMILRSWDQLYKAVHDEKEDPTSIYGGEL